MRRSGFMLIEMTAVIILIGAFVLLASRLFVGTIRVWSEARQGQEQATRFDSAVARLRADVWSADDLAVREDGALVLRGGESEVVWIGEPLSRDQRGFDDVGQSLRFAVRGPAVMLTARSTTGEESLLILPSQAAIAAGGGR